MEIDSDYLETAISARLAEIEAKNTGKRSSTDLDFLIQLRIMELLEDIKTNTTT